VILAAFTGVHSIGLRIGSSLTAIISTAIGVMLMILIVGCLLVSPAPAFMGPPLANAAASLPPMSMAMVFAMVPALRAVLTAYDGWYQKIPTLPEPCRGRSSAALCWWLLSIY
jgi:hypothetical protein